MEYRKVGNSGLYVSEITLGSWLTYGKTVENETAEKIIEQAIALGINSFDCADVYEAGQAELVLGNTLARYKRQNMVVSSKVYFPMTEEINDKGLSRKHIMESIDASLDRLKMNYLDIYYCHRFDTDTPLEETLEALNDLVRQGKILYIGVSQWTADQMNDAFEIIIRRNFSRIIVNQPPYNLIDRNIEDGTISGHHQLGVGQMVYSPLAQGILTGKYNNGIPADSRMANTNINAWVKENFDQKVKFAQKCNQIAQQLDISLTELALAWILKTPQIASCIIGATKVSQLNECVKASGLAKNINWNGLSL